MSRATAPARPRRSGRVADDTRGSAEATLDTAKVGLLRTARAVLVDAARARDEGGSRVAVAARRTLSLVENAST